MKWKGRRGSDNVKDHRGRRVSAGAGAGALGLLFKLGSRFGIKGILAVVVVGVLMWQMGLVDPAQLLGGSPQVRDVPVQATAEEQERLEFVRVVLADTEDIWNREFQSRGGQYLEPRLVVFRDAVQTACGGASSASGPFYCPADRQIYIDLGFYDQLEQSFDAPGDFAQAYVIAHEVGHHIQTLLGTSQQVHAKRGQPDYNQWSVRLELQADYYAGVWAHHSRQYLERGDIEEAMRAANAIGDDTIQNRHRGRALPHTFTHGTSEQRMRWFQRGLERGDMEGGDTFSIPYTQL
ncbi:MAG: neutral zinc metallopeptidase [Xanthomonadales bacterium]|nr:neutral zinc metallopeptidase [Xanthomonadales bacterium]